ncbi:hypothetical protein ACP70R_033658 [Stipagrostis hirtigluma subsp. patula]
MVEILTCFKDWVQERTQHTVEDHDLENAFSELYLDNEYVEGGQGTTAAGGEREAETSAAGAS